MSKKILVIGTIIILISAIAGGLFYWWQGGINNQRIIWNVHQEDINKQDSAGIQSAIFENQQISGQEVVDARKKSSSLLSINKIEQNGEWAWISVSNIDGRTKETIPTEGIGFLAHKIEGKWKVVRPDEKEFIDWLPNVPESLISETEKEYFYMLLDVSPK
jgi:hypothetical protein